MENQVPQVPSGWFSVDFIASRKAAAIKPQADLVATPKSLLTTH
jgi:hypothetical protein